MQRSILHHVVTITSILLLL